jgi:hypothetical protein
MPRNKKEAAPKRKRASRKKTTPKATKAKASTKSTLAGKSRAEGIRLFNLAGRPSKDDFVKVLGPDGPKMTWDQRAAAGVPASKFQAVLATKQSGRKDAKPSILPLTVKD